MIAFTDPDPQPITVTEVYDPQTKLVKGEASWDLSSIAVTFYLEILTFGIVDSPDQITLLAATGNPNSNPKAGNSLFFNPALLPNGPAKVAFQVSLLVFRPVEPAKFFSSSTAIIFRSIRRRHGRTFPPRRGFAPCG
jgi:hypothetical protein